MSNSFTSGVLIVLVDAKFEIENITLAKSQNILLHSLYSTGMISNIKVADLTTPLLIYMRSCELSFIQNIHVANVDFSVGNAIHIQNTKIEKMKNISFAGINTVAINILESTISSMSNVVVSNSMAAVHVKSSTIQSINGMKVSNCGFDDYDYSGGVYSRLSNITITNSEFINNKARVGAAVHIDCDPHYICSTSVMSTSFRGNSAQVKGGGIAYDLQRPFLNSNTFVNNSAPYGPDIASYAAKIVRKGTTNSEIHIDNVGSGIIYDQEIVVEVLDNDDHIMDNENTATVKIVSIINEDEITGIVSQKLINGTAIFSNLTFRSQAGKPNVKYRLVSSLLDTTRVKYGANVPQSMLFVSFRD